MEDNYKPSKKFTDQAWSEMQALLDKEMPDKGAILLVPNEGERNRFLLLLPLLLLLVMAALFFYYQANHGLSNTDGVEVNETVNLAIFPQSGEHNLGEKTENRTTLEANSNVSISANNQPDDSNTYVSAGLFDSGKVKTTNKPKSAISKSFNEAKVSNLNTQIASTETQDNPPFLNTPDEDEIENADKERALTPFVTETKNLYEPLKGQEVETAKEVREPVAIVVPIDGKLLRPLTFSTEEATVERFKDIKKLKSKLPIYASIGARNYDFSNNVNFVAGMETVLRKADKKLGLRTGLNYAQRSTTYLTRAETITIANLNDANFGMALESADQEGYYNARAELNAEPIEYHFLELPMFLDYKLSKKWSLHAGLSGKALIYSSTQDFGLLNGIANNNQDAAVFEAISENEPEGELNNISYFEPRQFNVGISGGVNFMATPRLGLQARFSQNLQDVYPELFGKQVSNSVEMGLSWRLR